MVRFGNFHNGQGRRRLAHKESLSLDFDSTDRRLARIAPARQNGPYVALVT